MPYTVKCCFEIYGTILLMLKVLFTQDFEVKDLFCGASSGSEHSMFFSKHFFSLGFEHDQDDFEHNFTWMTYEANGSEILTEL